MGRNRKPTNVLKMENTKVYKCRAGDRDGEPISDGLPKKPRGLHKIASDHWDFCIPLLVKMKVAKESDTPALVEMCNTWADKELLRKEPDFLTSTTYNKYLNASKQWLTIASRFGLTPADRAKIDVRSPEEKKNNTKKYLA